jgi:hypothetical protein
MYSYEERIRAVKLASAAHKSMSNRDMLRQANIAVSNYQGPRNRFPPNQKE